jgi:hypothetical protein
MSAAPDYIEIDYEPRVGQQELHDLMDQYRFGVTVAHRRFGKSVCKLNELQKRALTTDKERYRGSYVAPFYSMAKQIMWDYAKHYSSVVPGVKHNEAELRVDFPNGARIRLFGADKPGTLKGIYHDDVILDEFDQMKMEVWTQSIRPAIADREGNAYFIGTFEYTNGPLGQIYDLALAERNWFARIYKASETKVLPQQELDDAKKVMSAEAYAREFECSRAMAVVGSIYGRWIDEAEADGRICQVPYEPNVGVTTAWDLGMGDSTAIWFAQVVGREVRLIDYYENQGEDLEFYIQKLKEKPYTYMDHIGPHDLGVRDYTGSNGRTRLEIARGLGINFRVLPRVSQQLRREHDERIDIARRMLPKCVFDVMKTKPGVDALRSYRRTQNAVTGEFNSIPHHDWAAHGSDAFGYLAMGLIENRNVSRPMPQTRWIT